MYNGRVITSTADLIPYEKCDSHGLYLMDPTRKFDCNVAIFSCYDNCFRGLTMIGVLAIEKHHTFGGAARPVKFLERWYPGVDLEPYRLDRDIVERPMQTTASITNWEMFNYLEEFEAAWLDGAFV